jgi:hypothetical protein
MILLGAEGGAMDSARAPAAARVDRPDLHCRDRTPAGRPASSGGFLPYVPMVAVLGVVIVLQLNGRVSSLGEELAEHALVVLLIVRQYLTLRPDIARYAAKRSGKGRIRHAMPADR